MGTLRIVSRSDEPFLDRRQAGRLLAWELAEHRGRGAVVLGIPRGGIVVAREAARALDGELDIVLARKLRAPGHPELAMGSVAEDGTLFLEQETIRTLGVSEAYVQQEKAEQMAEMRRRMEMVRAVRPKVTLRGRVVIVIDDGIATGSTYRAALRAARGGKPRTLVAAIPVGPIDTVAQLAGDADELVCLRAPWRFGAVGQFYRQFDQVGDDEVVRLLEEERAGAGTR